VRTLIKQDFENALGQCDVIASPVTPYPAFKLGEKLDDPLQMYLADIYTISANLAGIPAMSIPCGFSEGLPVGLQLMGKHFDEASLITVGHKFQQTTDFHSQEAPL
jgi:aspartyl-tRNA(Asn)/glutamyl-tRNA(Gln) amidotransferase subunit A